MMLLLPHNGCLVQYDFVLIVEGACLWFDYSKVQKDLLTSVSATFSRQHLDEEN